MAAAPATRRGRGAGAAPLLGEGDPPRWISEGNALPWSLPPTAAALDLSPRQGKLAKIRNAEFWYNLLHQK